MEKNPTPRQVALQCLQKWEAGNAFAETIIDQTADKARLATSDRNLMQAVVFGVLRNKTWLDYVLGNLRQGRLDQQTRIILEIGLCQIFLMRLAKHAAVFETVNIAPEKTRGLVNAILRNALRREEELLAERNTLPLDIRFSTPKWLVSRWIEAFGERDTIAMLELNNQPPSFYVRRNPLIELADDPRSLVPLDNIPGWYSVNGPLPLDDIRSGALYVADPSTRYAVELLDPKPGERILDACAAPGGKSAAIIAATHGQALLTATDMHAHRLPVLFDNLRRQGSDLVETAQADWTHPCPPCWKGYFDAVLLDVPCSNTGVIQRRVDVRWRLTPKEISRLADIQLLILEQAAASVKAGGRLVYSTCSIDREEDRDVIDRFLAVHPDFTFQKEQLALPFREMSDGAYAALLIRA